MTEEELRQALAPIRTLSLVAVDTDGRAGAYATVEHVNGARWVLAVRQATTDAGAAEVAREVCNAVAKSMLSDASELVGSLVRVVARGRNES